MSYKEISVTAKGALLVFALTFTTPTLPAVAAISGDGQTVSSEGSEPGYNPSADVTDPTEQTEPELPCNFEKLIGQDINSVNRAQFGNRPLRILHYGDPVTEDFSPSRINIILDKSSHVTQVSCG